MTSALFFVLGLLEMSKVIPGYGGAITGPELSLAIVVVASALLAFLKSKSGIRVPKLTYIGAAGGLLLLFSVWHAFSPIFSNRDFVYSVSLTAVLAAGYMKRFALSNSLEGIDLRAVCFAYALGVAVGVALPYLLGTIGLVVAGPMFMFAGRYQAFLEHPNQVGIASTFVVVLAMTLRLNLLKRMALLAPSLMALFLCGSKFNIALSLFVLAAGSAFMLTPGRMWMKSVGAAIGVVVALSLSPLILRGVVDVLMQINPREANRLAQFVIAPDRSESATERFFIWGEGVRGALENLPLGVGLDDAPTYLKGLNHAHNLFIHYGLVWGIGGLIFCIALVIFCASRLVDLARENRSTSSADLLLAASAAAMSLILTSLSSDSLSVSVMPLILTMISMILVRGQNVRSEAPCPR